MEQSLINYLNKRIESGEPTGKKPKEDGNPLICISREAGCGGVKVAELLAAKLNENLHAHKWRVISKEIVVETAKALDIDETKLDYIIKDNNKSIFYDILSAFGDKRFKSRKTIGKTLKAIINSIEEEGFCIIVGRASQIIAQNNKKALLLQFNAPLDWRINEVMKKYMLNKEGAFDLIQKIEKERLNLRTLIAGNISTHEEFDLTFNSSRFDNDQMIEIILFSLRKKGLI